MNGRSECCDLQSWSLPLPKKITYFQFYTGCTKISILRIKFSCLFRFKFRKFFLSCPSHHISCPHHRNSDSLQTGSKTPSSDTKAAFLPPEINRSRRICWLLPPGTATESMPLASSMIDGTPLFYFSTPYLVWSLVKTRKPQTHTLVFCLCRPQVSSASLLPTSLQPMVGRPQGSS